MRNGKQEELDAAREDARLIPENALFRVSENSKDYSIGGICYQDIDGVFVGAVVVRSQGFDDKNSVGFKPYADGKIINVCGCAHMDANDLEPI